MIVMVISESHSDPSSYNIVDMEAWFPTEPEAILVKTEIENALYGRTKEYYEEGYRTCQVLHESDARQSLPSQIDAVVHCFVE